MAQSSRTLWRLAATWRDRLKARAEARRTHARRVRGRGLHPRLQRASRPISPTVKNVAKRAPTAATPGGVSAVTDGVTAPTAASVRGTMWLVAMRHRLQRWGESRRWWWHLFKRRVDPRGVISSPLPPQMVANYGERPVDLWLLGAVLGLLTIGTLAIHSATMGEALSSGKVATHFLGRQALFLTLGGVAMVVGARFNYQRLRGATYVLLLVALLLLAAALVFPPRNGARRWIPLGPLTFQPVEVAKLALITYLAYSLGRKAEQVKTFTVGFVPHVVVCGLMMALLLKQPDLGSSIVLGAATLGMLFVAGARIFYIVLAVLAATPVAYYLVVGTPWRMQRFLAYFNPEAFAHKEAYQFLQARLALGSGGFSGLGLGAGQQTLGYMPESHNDFVLAPIGEELGFMGVALVFALFGLLIWRGVRAALGARDVFGGYMALGITMMFGVQALFNAGVVLGLVPNKGITLPLVSYGGTSLIVTMFLVGFLLNVGCRRERRGVQRELVNASFARRRKPRVRVVVA